MDRVLWRGFNHPGEPPADGIEGRKKMQSVPNFNKDLKIVTVAPNGNLFPFAACGMTRLTGLRTSSRSRPTRTIAAWDWAGLLCGKASAGAARWAHANET
jgi:hypothetical protein